MADEQPDYLVGNKGVNIVDSPLHTPEHGLLVAKNVEFKRVMGFGGLGSRDGIRPLNLTALNGPIMALVDVPLDTDVFTGGGGGGRATGIYLAIDPGGGGELWLYSADGVTFSLVPTATLPYGAPGTTAHTFLFPWHFAITRSGVLFFYSFDPLGTSVSLVSFDGATPLVRVPGLPVLVSGGLLFMKDLLVADGGIYFVSQAASSPPTDLVYFYNPTSGTVTAIFAPGILPSSNDGTLAIALGFLWWNLGTEIWRRQEPSGFFVVNQPSPVDPTTFWYGAVNYGGFFYFGEANSGAPLNDLHINVIDTPGGSPSVSDTQTIAHASASYIPSIVFNGLLFAVFKDPDPGTPVQKIFSFDGATWSLELDLVGTFGVTETAQPYPPFVFGLNLYWPVYDGASGFLLKRTPGGVWTQAVTGKSLRGPGGAVS